MRGEGQRAPVGRAPAPGPRSSSAKSTSAKSSPTPTCVAVIEKMIKQRRESIAQFEQASRKDLADVEKFELAVLSGYLPQQMSEAEVDAGSRRGGCRDAEPAGSRTWAR